jgi:hypothetical protein
VGAGLLLNYTVPVAPRAAEKRPVVPEATVPPAPSPLQGWNFFDPQGPSPASLLPPPDTTVAKGDTDGAPPAAVRAETEPAAELSVALRPVESRRMVELSPPLEQPQATRQPEVQRPAPKRHAATAAPKPADRPPLRTRTAKREPTGKRHANEALRTVRTFNDDLQDIPVSAYTADGTRRSVVIHPTSIQDVYYYSVPR